MTGSSRRPPLTGQRLGRAIGVALVIVAGCLALGSFLLVQAAGTRTSGQPLAGGARTMGSVVAVAPSCLRGCSYIPTISFTADGRTYTFTGVVHDSKPAIGSSVPVSYDPADPLIARDLGGGSAHWITDAVIGGIFCAFGLWLSYMVATGPRRRRRKESAAAANAAPTWDPTWDESLRDQPRDEDTTA